MADSEVATEELEKRLSTPTSAPALALAPVPAPTPAPVPVPVPVPALEADADAAPATAVVGEWFFNSYAALGIGGAGPCMCGGRAYICCGFDADRDRLCAAPESEVVRDMLDATESPRGRPAADRKSLDAESNDPSRYSTAPPSSARTARLYTPGATPLGACRS